jgi:hypothetical protein
MENIFFDSWQSLARSFFVTVLAYAGMILFLRGNMHDVIQERTGSEHKISIAL